jgi:hypothetical protein
MSEKIAAAKTLYELRFKEGLTWPQMRERTGRQLRSTAFMAQMVPYAKRANVLKKHADDGSQPCEALVNAVERAAEKGKVAA